MKRKFIIVLSLLLALSVAGCRVDNDIVKIPKEWKLAEKPDTDSKKWNRMNWDNEIVIRLDNGSIIAETGEPNTLPSFLAVNKGTSINSGTFIGLNHGEWGGFIMFVPIEGSEYKIINENFQGFYEVGDKIYALTGLAHLGLSRGSIYELVFVENKWQAVETSNIGYAPEVFLLAGEDLYIATSDTLIIVRDGKISDVLIENASWGTQYPNSMIYANNSIFVGMRDWVCEYNLDTRTEKWYDFSNE